jgi:hypothetical protein
MTRGDGDWLGHDDGLLDVVDPRDEMKEPDWFAMPTPPRTSRSSCLRLILLCSRACAAETRSAHSRSFLQNRRAWLHLLCAAPALLSHQVNSLLHEQLAMPPDFVRCPLLDGLRHLLYAAPLSPPRADPRQAVTLHSSSSFSCCRTRHLLWPCRVAGPATTVLAKVLPCAASLPFVRVGPESPHFTSIRARPNRARPWSASR